MAREEDLIIRRSKGKFVRCLFCNELYATISAQCPHCLKYSNNIYYFQNSMSHNMKSINDNLWSVLVKMQSVCNQNALAMEEIRHLMDKVRDEELIEQPSCSWTNPQDEEPWITPLNFSKQTGICIPGMVSIMFKRDPKLFAACGMRKGVKYYLKRDAMVDYLRQFAEGRILNNTFKYLERREETCQPSTKTTQPKPRIFPPRPRS